MAKMMYMLSEEVKMQETPEEERWRLRLEYLQRIETIEKLFSITKEKEMIN